MTNNDAETTKLLRSLKKSAAALLVLSVAHKPLTALEVAQILEINKDTASLHLQSLESIGLVNHLGKFVGYTINTESPDFPALFGEKRKFPAFLPTTAANNTSNNDSKNLLSKTSSVKAVVAQEKRKNPAFLKNRNALKKCGIGEPTLSRIADMDHITPDYLKCHIKHWRSEHGRPGLLIHRLRNNDPIPENGDWRETPEGRKKYLSGNSD